MIPRGSWFVVGYLPAPRISPSSQSIRPVFDMQLGNLTKSPVVCHQYRAYAQRVRGNQQVKWRKRFALSLRICTHTEGGLHCPDREYLGRCVCLHSLRRQVLSVHDRGRVAA